MVLGQAMTLVAVGLGLGLAGALAAGRTIASLLYDVTPHDAATLGAVSTLLLAVALVAVWVPARRATAIEPLRALRDE